MDVQLLGLLGLIVVWIVGFGTHRLYRARSSGGGTGRVSGLSARSRKWRHPDPTRRRKAITTAMTTADIPAVLGLNDQDILEEIAIYAKPKDVAEAAMSKLNPSAVHRLATNRVINSVTPEMRREGWQDQREIRFDRQEFLIAMVTDIDTLSEIARTDAKDFNRIRAITRLSALGRAMVDRAKIDAETLRALAINNPIMQTLWAVCNEPRRNDPPSNFHILGADHFDGTRVRSNASEAVKSLTDQVGALIDALAQKTRFHDAPDAALLLAIATSSHSSTLQKAGVYGLSDPTSLEMIARTTTHHENVRAAALRRLSSGFILESVGDERELAKLGLLGKSILGDLDNSDESGPLREMSTELENSVVVRLKDSRSLGEYARIATAPETRILAVQRLESQSALRDIAISDLSAEVRQAAVERLDSSESLLTDIARSDKSLTVRRTALSRLSEDERRAVADATAVTEHLLVALETLKSGHGEARFEAVKTLCLIDDDRAVDAVFEAISNDPYHMVRAYGLSGLATRCTPRLIEAVVAAFEDPNGVVQDEAFEIVKNLDDEQAHLYRPSLVPALMSRLDSGTPPGQRGTWVQPLVAALGRVKATEAVGLLVERVLSWQPTQAIAARALGDIGDIRAIEHLARALKDSSDNHDRDALAAALQKLGAHDLAKTMAAEKSPLDIARDPTSKAADLQSIARSDELEVVMALARNPSTPAPVLRQLNEKWYGYSDSPRFLWGHFIHNLSCPSDLLAEIASKTINPETRDAARAHVNFSATS